MTGGSVVPGIALGPALALDRTLPAVETRSIDDPPAEQAWLDRAMAGVGAELEAVVVRTRARMAAGGAGIIGDATAHPARPGTGGRGPRGSPPQRSVPKPPGSPPSRRSSPNAGRWPTRTCASAADVLDIGGACWPNSPAHPRR
ncbi:MAG: phosphoenolpyruvate-utilizing N-terminal domain-containing protein [Caldilineaceae bacterium]